MFGRIDNAYTWQVFVINFTTQIEVAKSVTKIKAQSGLSLCLLLCSTSFLSLSVYLSVFFLASCFCRLSKSFNFWQITLAPFSRFKEIAF